MSLLKTVHGGFLDAKAQREAKLLLEFVYKAVDTISESIFLGGFSAPFRLCVEIAFNGS